MRALRLPRLSGFHLRKVPLEPETPAMERERRLPVALAAETAPPLASGNNDVRIGCISDLNCSLNSSGPHSHCRLSVYRTHHFSSELTTPPLCSAAALRSLQLPGSARRFTWTQRRVSLRGCLLGQLRLGVAQMHRIQGIAARTASIIGPRSGSLSRLLVVADSRSSNVNDAFICNDNRCCVVTARGSR